MKSDSPSQPGMVRVDRMGTKTVRGLLRAGHLNTVPVPVLTTALDQRFATRGESDFQDTLLSGMRFGFGGHLEKPVK
jgi:6-phosphogluconate dehydrogenase